MSCSFTLPFLIVVHAVLVGKARPVDIEVHCSNYTDGELAYANATVNRNTVRENQFCLSGTLTGVQFNFMILGTVTATRVEGTSYDWAGGSCRTSWSGYARCLCLDNSTNVFTYQVRFIANKKVHSRLYLTFDTDCAGVTSPGNPFTVDHSSCDPIPVVYDKAQHADIVLHCSSFKDGQLAYATATVYRNTVTAVEKCRRGFLTQVSFQFKTKETSTVVRTESASYDWDSGTCNTAWNGNVRCLRPDSSSDVLTYELRFTANKTKHYQQYLTLETDCVGPTGTRSPFTVNYSSCDPIPVVHGREGGRGSKTGVLDGNTRQPATTEYFAATNREEGEGEEGDKVNPKRTWIIVGVVAAVLTALVVVLAVVCCQCRRKSTQRPDGVNTTTAATAALTSDPDNARQGIAIETAASLGVKAGADRVLEASSALDESNTDSASYLNESKDE